MKGPSLQCELTPIDFFGASAPPPHKAHIHLAQEITEARCFLHTISTMRPSSTSTLARCLFRSTAPRAAFSPQLHIPVPRRLLHTPRTAIGSLPRPILALTGARCLPVHTRRHESTNPAPAPSRLERDQVPAYELTFTCNKCSTRSSHRVSKQGYHHGTVLITCPGCKNRHLMSDHLKVRPHPITNFIQS